MKKCSKCKITKELDEFTKNSKAKDGRKLWCKGCCKTSRRNWYTNNKETAKSTNRKWQEKNLDFSKTYYLKNKDKWRERQLLKDFGISLNEYEKMFASQNGCCWICNLPENGKLAVLCVDHCHKTGKIRGLLCSNCNKGLGYFRDNAQFLLNATKYLSK